MFMVLSLGITGSRAVAAAGAQQSAASRKALESAAAKGSAPAQYALGAGAEANGDFQQAASWYRQAAEKGYAAAQFKLGELLESGKGASADKVQAATWYRKAAAQGFAAATIRLHALDVAASSAPPPADTPAPTPPIHTPPPPTPTEPQRAPAAAPVIAEPRSEPSIPVATIPRAEGQPASRQTQVIVAACLAGAILVWIGWSRYRRTAAAPHSASAWNRRPAIILALTAVGLCVVAFGIVAGVKYLAAAPSLSPQAQFTLGLQSRDGDQVAQSYATAAQWFQKAADRGYAPAQFELATLLRLGLGVRPDADAGLRTLARAAVQGYPPAVTLGGILEVTRAGGDTTRGLQWLKAAANFGDPWAQSQLAAVYMEGHLEAPDHNKALYWIERAHATNAADFKELRQAIWQGIPASSRELARVLVSAQIGHDLESPPAFQN